MDNQITKIINRHIGKILEVLDQIQTSSVIKQGIKSQLWLLHDDVQQIISKEYEKNAGTSEPSK